jgi:hypothetical protein
MVEEVVGVVAKVLLLLVALILVLHQPIARTATISQAAEADVRTGLVSLIPEVTFLEDQALLVPALTFPRTIQALLVLVLAYRTRTARTRASLAGILAEVLVLQAAILACTALCLPNSRSCGVA